VELVFLAFIFLLGVSVGSFLNVVILRFEKGERVFGRSYCPACKKTLRWFELIPLFSFLLQGGKCRSCAATLSLQYPFIEAGAGILFVLLYGKLFSCLPFDFSCIFSGTLNFIFHTSIFSTLLIILVIDLHHKIIPDRFSFIFSAISLLLLFIALDSGSVHIPSLLEFAAGPLLFLPFFLLWYISKGKWIGLGDGKLSLGIGWFLGLSGGISALLLAFWIGAVLSLSLLTSERIVEFFRKGTMRLPQREKTLTMKSEIPFGPFLILGIFLVYFFNIDIISFLVS